MSSENRPAAEGGKDRGSLSDRLRHELKTFGLTALFFLCWIGALLFVKHLLLEEYGIRFDRLSVAFVGALILSKVVLVLELVPLGSWVESKPAWVDVILRTVLYSLGVALVMLLEKGFEGRHEFGGFVPSLQAVFEHTDIQHVRFTVLSGRGRSAQALLRTAAPHAQGTLKLSIK